MCGWRHAGLLRQQLSFIFLYSRPFHEQSRDNRVERYACHLITSIRTLSAKRRGALSYSAFSLFRDASLGPSSNEIRAAHDAFASQRAGVARGCLPALLLSSIGSKAVFQRPRLPPGPSDTSQCSLSTVCGDDWRQRIRRISLGPFSPWGRGCAARFSRT